MVTKRTPSGEDLLVLAKALHDFEVEYIVIGGAAMALHGFPRMTKDIDLLLPVDHENNKRLLLALDSMPENRDFLPTLRPEWMDKGFSTALEGEINIDLLYVAASQSFEGLRDHIRIVSFDGVPVVTLDVDGMLITKQTTRESDVPDRLKLGRLKTAMRDSRLRQDRIAMLSTLESTQGTGHIFWRLADEAMKTIGLTEKINWSEIEQKTIAESIGEHGESPDVVADLLCKYSPGAVFASQQEVLRSGIQKLAANLQAGFEVSKGTDFEKGCQP